MTTNYIYPNSDSGSGVVVNGGAAGVWEALSDASDATYVSGMIFESARVYFPNVPSLGTGELVESVEVLVRRRSATNGINAPLRVGMGDGTVWLIGINYGAPWDSSSSSWVDATASINQNITQAQIDGLNVSMYTGIQTTYCQVSRCYIKIVSRPKPSQPSNLFSYSPVNDSLTGLCQWTHEGELTQSKYRLKVFTSTQGDPENATAVWDSGEYTSSTTNRRTGTLTNEDTYYWYVKTAQNVNGTTQWSDYSAVGSFAIDVDQGVPTGVVPAASSTISSPYLTFDADGGGALDTKRQWQVASDSGFSSNVTLVDEGVFRTDHTSAGSYAPSSDTWTQGTWYVRARLVDEYALAGGWSGANTFTVSHAPTASISAPTGGIAIDYSTTPELSWAFADPWGSDTQTAFQVELWQNGNKGGTLIDSGKVTSSATTHSPTVTAGWKDLESRWRVRVYDTDDVVSSYSSEGSFWLRDGPVPVVTYPTNGGTVGSAAPTFTWTFSATDGRTQVAYRVRVTDTDADNLVIDSETLAGSVLSWTAPTPVLEQSVNYSIQVDLTDSTGLVGTDINTFTAVYDAPTSVGFSLTTSTYETTGGITVDWSGATDDTDWIAWRIYGRKEATGAWRLVHEQTNVLLQSYVDYTAPSHTDYQYAVVQVITILGDEVESVRGTTDFYGTSPDYFLVVPTQPSLNVKLQVVTSDSFSDEQEMSTFNLIGRGRRVEYGTRYGQTGSLTAQLYNTATTTAREKRLAIEAIRDSGLELFLRNPFGDVWNVALLSANFERMAGVGDNEYVTASIGYMEITA